MSKPKLIHLSVVNYKVILIMYTYTGAINMNMEYNIH
jgi:hypothetical protein